MKARGGTVELQEAEALSERKRRRKFGSEPGGIHQSGSEASKGMTPKEDVGRKSCGFEFVRRQALLTRVCTIDHTLSQPSFELM